MRIDMANNTAEFGTIGQFTLISKSELPVTRQSIRLLRFRRNRGAQPVLSTGPSYTQHFPGVTPRWAGGPAENL